MLRRIFFAALLSALCISASAAEPKLKALIVDGQNNHGAWPKTTFMMKKYLEQTGLFTVDIARTKFTWRGEQHLGRYPLLGSATRFAAQPKPKPDPDFKPNFSDYDLVVSNYNGAPWPAETQEAFVKYVKGGGGFAVVHAADNAFGDWKQYNEIIGLGGWGGRDEKSGPYVYFDDAGKLVRDDRPGKGGHHGPHRPFTIVIRDDTHPITRGMLHRWRHAKDELYDLLRGPAKNLQVLATAYADAKQGGSGRHEPMIFTIRYGKGRVFHTPMGHDDHSMECVGFIVTFQRGAQWAATGQVTQPIPADFPTAEAQSLRKFE